MVVVDAGDGVLHTKGISFAAAEISGLEALELAGFAPLVRSFGGMGSAVCALTLDGTRMGCPADPSCLTCAEPAYWTYFQAPDGSDRFRQAPVGASRTRVRAGGVEAWRWGTGAAPAFVAYDSVWPPLPPTTTTTQPPATTSTTRATTVTTAATPATTPAGTPSPNDSGGAGGAGGPGDADHSTGSPGSSGAAAGVGRDRRAARAPSVAAASTGAVAGGGAGGARAVGPRADAADGTGDDADGGTARASAPVLSRREGSPAGLALWAAIVLAIAVLGLVRQRTRRGRAARAFPGGLQ